MAFTNKKGEGVTGTSAAKKPIYIVLIVIALVVILVLVYFGTKTLAGKAIAAPGTILSSVDSAGILGTEVSGTTLSVGIGANIESAESVAFEFELKYPVAVTLLVANAFVPGKDWGADAFLRVTPVTESDSNFNILKIEYATLDAQPSNTLTGAVTLGRVQFTGNAAATDFTLQNVRVWSIPATATDSIRNLASNIITPAGETQTQCTANELCPSWFTPQRDTLCAYSTECLNQGFVLAGASAGYNADLTLDGEYNANDALIVYGTAQAKSDDNCGAPTEIPCLVADGVYVCENGAFRMRGLSIYNNRVPYVHNEATTCSQFTMVR